MRGGHVANPSVPNVYNAPALREPCATPKRLSGIRTGFGNTAAHRLAAIGTARRIRVGVLPVPLIKSGAVHALAESTLLKELFFQEGKLNNRGVGEGIQLSVTATFLQLTDPFFWDCWTLGTDGLASQLRGPASPSVPRVRQSCLSLNVSQD